MRNFIFRQFLPVWPEESWKFFSNPANLGRITPPSMNFIITSELPEKIYEGLIITYRVSPLFNIPVTWVTEITRMKEPYYFVDEQRAGPFSIWHHEHHFEPQDAGLIMTDKLFYKVPFGLPGRMIDALIVHRQIMAIFDYRKRILETHPEMLRQP